MNLPDSNRLAVETSPYLLQHARNPVDWFPWGDEAFAAARSADKPIFLSIGYSTCHWCHVMERESFENPAVAAVLNEHFVSIKVDREERPDVDKIYMTAVQMMGLGGGWPLSVWLTPALQPFYGGTYFPPESASGRIGFRALLERIAQLWREERPKLEHSAGELTAHLATAAATERTSTQALSAALLDRAARSFMEEYDPRHGGFGGAPKFPRPSVPRFLMRHARRAADPMARDMVVHTLVRMANGGIYDQLGGGFSRYSVDERWLVPHFEKMLYDQAQIVHAALDALQSGCERDLLSRVVRETADYVLRDLGAPDGTFYCAEDADSEGREGTFYVWSPDQIRAALPAEEAELALTLLGVTEVGNFSDHSAPGPQPPSQNVLSLVRPLSQLTGRDPDTTAALWDSARKRLFDVRSTRPRPHRDTKVLTSWNGLMIGALARAGAVLEESRFIDAARRAAAQLRSLQYDAATGRLRHSVQPERSGEPALLDDYAFLLDGLLELHQATLDVEWLTWADALATAMIDRFTDREHGGFFQSAGGGNDLIVRVKEDYDGAEPSGNSVAALALIRLAALLERPGYRDEAQRVLELFAHRLASLPHALPHLAMALDEYLAPSVHVTITGTADDPRRQALLREVHARFLPGLTLIDGALSADAAPTAQLCVNQACRLPLNDPGEFARALDELSP